MRGDMLPGVYPAKKKDGTPYFRASIHYHGTHVSLGSFTTPGEANAAYREADRLYHDQKINISNFQEHTKILKQDKIVTILNHRDHNIYIKTPIYLRSSFFSYFLDEATELKFDNDDLFYYSSHRILKRQGHLYVNDYGMQYSILSRFGIKGFAVAGKDYQFANGDETDYRYANIIVINKYHGVTRIESHGTWRHEARIHLNGEFLIGRFRTDAMAAVAYNKAVDYAKDRAYPKNFIQNYVIEYTPKEYAEVYTEINLPLNYRNYIDEFVTGQIAE